MTDFFQVLKTRRSVRTYAHKPVREDELKELIELATFAPSGGNRQPWAFTVITNRELLDKLNDRIKAIMRGSGDRCYADFGNDPNYSIFYDAPALVIITGEV